MTAVETVRCDYCGTDVPAGEAYHPYGNVIRCRDESACKTRQVYAGSHTEPPRRTAATAVSDARPCAICGADRPPGGLFERSGGVAICIDRSGCDARAIDYQFLTAHGDDGQVEYTAAQMRAAAATSVAMVAAPPQTVY